MALTSCFKRNPLMFSKHFFQVNDLITGFTEVQYRSRYNDLLYLHLFDWSTMSSEMKSSSISSSDYWTKSYPICTTFNDADNKMNLMYMATNGYLSAIGIKDFSSANGLTQLPKNMDRNSDTSSFSQLIAANNKTELFLYGGQVGDDILDGIYKYSLTTNLWTKINTMIHPRASHVVLPVHGLSCP